MPAQSVYIELSKIINRAEHNGYIHKALLLVTCIACCNAMLQADAKKINNFINCKVLLREIDLRGLRFEQIVNFACAIYGRFTHRSRKLFNIIT